jgi:hypothetical protein
MFFKNLLVFKRDYAKAISSGCRIIFTHLGKPGLHQDQSCHFKDCTPFLVQYY